MWLSRSPLVMVVVSVLLGVKMARANTHSLPRLKHFSVYGCQTNKTLFKNIKMNYLKSRSEFLVGVGGESSRPTITLLASSSSSPPCKLTTNTLFRAQPATETTNERITVTFQSVVLEDHDSELINGTGNSTSNELDEDSEEVPSGEEEMTCSFSVYDVLKLHSGYGFISCQVDVSGSKVWQAWQEGVTAAVEEAATTRTNIIIGVVCGTCAIVMVIVTCFLCRLKSAHSGPYDSRRRPSNTSAGIRTGSTHDHHSSRN